VSNLGILDLFSLFKDRKIGIYILVINYGLLFLLPFAYFQRKVSMSRICFKENLKKESLIYIPLEGMKTYIKVLNIRLEELF